MRYLAILACVIGILFCWYLSVACCFTGAAGGGGCDWQVTDGTKTVVNLASCITFNKAGFAPAISDKSQDGLEDIAAYLKNNPEKTLTLTGLYENGETGNAGGSANLGEARAKSIKDKLLALKADPQRIFTKGKKEGDLDFNDNTLYNGINYSFGKVVAKKEEPKPKTNTATTAAAAAGAGLSIRDGGFGANDKGNFLFDKNDYRVNQPLLPGVSGALKKTAGHLNKNENKVVTITGLYEKDEKNTGAFENLGIARANSVKNEMVKLGAKRSQIETAGKMRNNLPFNDKNKLNGGIEFSFSEAKKNNDKLAQIEKRLKIGPKYLYFATGKDEVKLDADLRKYFADLVYYLDRKPNAKVNVVGHTDNVGQIDSNIRLGQGRADFVKKYLVSNGTGGKQISTSSQGPKKPIASNGNANGRAKNRRVEVRVP